VIGLGLIGCGDVAFRTYIPGVQAVAGKGTVVATFDPIAARAERAAALFPNATAYTSFEALLAHPGLDGVMNLTPAPFHRDTTSRALDAGLHVLSEKPIAATVEDGRALIAQAERVGKLLLCAPAVMATGRFRWLKQVLTDGRLGRPHLATAQMANMGPAGWRAYTGDPAVFYTKDVGPMLDTAVYVLHAITGLIGPAKRVEAFGGVAIPERKVLIERLAGNTIAVGANDVMMIHLDFGENRFAQILSSFAVPGTRGPALEVHGSQGSISIAAGAWYDAWGPVDVYRRDDTLLGLDGWVQNVSPPNRPEGPVTHLIGAGPAHFVGCLRGEEQPILTAEHALHVLEIILAATRSAAEGCAIGLETGF
jgi:predicted dehydrogenase